MQPEQKKELKILALIIILGLALRIAGSILFPLWSGPEEGAHYFYISFIGDNHALPMVQLTPETLAGIANESIHQPPLYYIFAAMFYSLMQNQSVFFIVHALRLLSVIFGVLCIPLTFFIAKRLSFNKTVCLASALFIALLPTHIATSATVSNSPMSWALALGVTYYSILALQEKKAIHIALAGLLFAATFMAMFTSIAVGITFAAAWLVFLLKGKYSPWKRILACAIPFVGAVVFIRNLALTGNLFPSHLRPMMQLSFSWFTYFCTHLFAGIWLQEYGTATIPDYRFIFFGFFAIFSLLAFIGSLALFLGKNWNKERKQLITIALILPIILNLAGVIYLNLFGVWPEARWLFATISLAAILFIAGLQQFAKLLHQENKASWLIWATLLAMLALDIALLWNYNPVLPDIIWNVPVFA